MADRFRYDAVMQVLWAGDQSYPATFHSTSLRDNIPPTSDFLRDYPDYRMETRQALVHFENQWQLSTIWGDAAYGSNYVVGEQQQREFIEEPAHVEVGVLMPFPIKHPAQTFPIPEGRETTVPAYETHLWGEPLAYVDVPMYHRVAWLVMHLPTEIDLPEGEWDDAQGFCDLLVTAGLERTFDDR